MTARKSNVQRIAHPPQIVPAPAAMPLMGGSDSSSTYQPWRDTVRTLIRDGQPSFATSPYGIVRQESLTDQIPAVATPTQTIFYVRWQNIPLGKNVTVTAVAGSIAAYVDGNNSPKTIGNSGVTSDIDQNGNFTLAVAPVSTLAVTYGWQVFADADIDNLLENARSWLQGFSDITLVPDGLNPALTYHAAAEACESIGRAMSLPDVTAGEARESLSQIAKSYMQSATAFYARADKARADYYTGGDQPLQPEASIISISYPVYQPFQ